MIEATKFYIRHREGYPETITDDYARRGFWELGVETASYEWIDDIDTLPDLSRTVGIAGWIGDVLRGFKKLGCPEPTPLDYPKELNDFLGRKVWRSTLGNVRSSVDIIFVKSYNRKQFTGFIWKADAESQRRIVTESDDVEVWLSDPVDMLSEYRVFVLDGKILDARHYKGDWGLVIEKKVVELAVEKILSVAPRAFCLDFAITKENKTILVEVNEGFSMGHYGLAPANYARMLSASWHEYTFKKLAGHS